MDIEEATQVIMDNVNVPRTDAELILKKADEGGELNNLSLDDWLEERFLPNIVYIDEEGYAKMCVDALKIAQGTAATDFGSSRQRDLGQLWGDMTRGYLAEYAFSLFLKENWEIEAELGHEPGEMEDFLEQDVHKIREQGEEWREPGVKIGIKGTKWNGIWFDLPGAQFEHSDIHTLVKVGVSRDHLFAFFKLISVFKDKILKKGIEVGALGEDDASELFDLLPEFTNIPAYVAGFVRSAEEFDRLSYGGRRGRLHFTITEWNGPYNKENDLNEIKRIENLEGTAKFQSIGTFSHSGYIFNTGSLLWEKEDWERHVIQNL